MGDANKYIGIPKKKGGTTLEGADCWGLHNIVAREEFGIDITLFEGHKAEGAELEKIIFDELESKRWVEELPQGGVTCLMYSSNGNRPEHIGICWDATNVLHSFGNEMTGSSSITSISILRRLFSKVEFYRYVG